MFGFGSRPSRTGAMIASMSAINSIRQMDLIVLPSTPGKGPPVGRDKKGK